MNQTIDEASPPSGIGVKQPIVVLLIDDQPVLGRAVADIVGSTKQRRASGDLSADVIGHGLGAALLAESLMLLDFPQSS